MKKNLLICSSFLILIFIVSSCSTSNDVASNRMIQKRKHLKGYHISTKQSLFKKSNQKNDNEDYLVIKDSQEKPTLKFDNELRHDVYKSVSIDENLVKVNVKQEGNLSNYSSAVIASTPKKPTQIKTLASNKIKNLVTKKKKVIETVRKKAKSSQSRSFIGVLLLILLAFLIPPLAVLIHEGPTGRFWLDLLLTLVGYGLGAWLLGPSLIWLGGVLAVIYALLIILNAI